MNYFVDYNNKDGFVVMNDSGDICARGTIEEMFEIFYKLQYTDHGWKADKQELKSLYLELGRNFMRGFNETPDYPYDKIEDAQKFFRKYGKKHDILSELNEYGIFLLDTDNSNNIENAKELVQAIKNFANNEYALENFESYLSYHFNVWIKRFASTPADLASEFKQFSKIGEEATA